MKTIEGKIDGKNLVLGVVVSCFNETITSSLLEGTLKTLADAGVALDKLTVVKVPGAYEIPLAAQKLAASKKFDAVITLGCVIRGDTIHFDRICQTTSDSLQRISLETGIPITSGIVMAENNEQARERAKGPMHRGVWAAQSALVMATVLQSL